MVITDMVIEEARTMPAADWAAGRKVFNLFGDTVEEATANIVERVLKNKKNGVNVHRLGKGKMLLRLLKAVFIRRDLFAEHGV